uniref:L27 domain-containing protein n=1 Tax=Steinernema glaseri TaxID=37863 RepID=A0A1I8ABT1_9BILA
MLCVPQQRRAEAEIIEARYERAASESASSSEALHHRDDLFELLSGIFALARDQLVVHVNMAEQAEAC